ncbi:hypothetical protein GCM10023186_15860 [Hymenobacter koreensis]|uniref:Uncharacterized protein n=1 Tax=Hymenobacter koreensis TaxID=1084523 RepID=A0ABP8IXQ7_9BACT
MVLEAVIGTGGKLFAVKHRGIGTRLQAEILGVNGRGSEGGTEQEEEQAFHRDEA